MKPPPQIDTPVTAADLASMGRQPGPFTLLLDAQYTEAKRLECMEVVRVIPGKRLVCRAEWQGKSVFAKLYLGARKDWLGELQGLNALHAAGIAAPGIVHTGTADQGAIHFILLEPVAPAVTLAAAWAQADDAATRIKLLQLAVTTVASHHSAGLEQRDIHLDNFLLSGKYLYTLDGGGIHLSGDDELSVSDSVDNLALFFAQLYPQFDALIEAAFQAYTRRRAWGAGTVTYARLQQRVRFFRRKRLRHYLKKIFRDCSAFDCIRRWRMYSVCDRTLVTEGMLKFLADPDASLQFSEMKYLKQGNTCTLWAVQVDQRMLVVKRYNIKGVAHRISRAFRATRAAVSWKNAHRLTMYGILTARPVALVEERFGPVRGRAWYISEFVAGDDASSLCGQAMLDKAGQIRAGQKLTDLLAQLALSSLSHGDMKATNFILSERGAVVIDLDAMRKHDAAESFQRAQRRDLRRFMRNWEACPETRAMFAEMMRARKLVTEL